MIPKLTVYSLKGPDWLWRVAFLPWWVAVLLCWPFIKVVRETKFDAKEAA